MRFCILGVSIRPIAIRYRTAMLGTDDGDGSDDNFQRRTI